MNKVARLMGQKSKNVEGLGIFGFKAIEVPERIWAEEDKLRNHTPPEECQH